MQFQKNILITGGAGFIGSHVVKHFVKQYKQYRIINIDALTYSGNLNNLAEIQNADNYVFIKGNICDQALIENIFTQYHISDVIHLAAESHVDRSIMHPMAFVETNILGTTQLLLAAKKYWDKTNEHIFYHISTDEVYGSLGDDGFFTEETAYDPRSPYSASKAASDHLVRAFYHTYKLPVVLSNCSNNYGAYQFPEKLIPLAIINILQGKNIPIYGKGENVRDWLYVQDHVEAIDTIFHKGTHGQTYNIGGNNEWKNIDLIKLLCTQMEQKMNWEHGKASNLITYVEDRKGHDLRYAIDASKLNNELGWSPKTTFEQGLSYTIDWYLSHSDWWKNILNGEYQHYYESQYAHR